LRKILNKSESTKKELEESRKEPLSGYVDHKKVLKEFQNTCTS
jgi:hypothetical protein